MAATLEGRPQDIIAAPNYAHLAIPRRDGTVQTVMMWADVDDGNIMVNSAEGRQWPDNLRRAGTATVTVMADSNPYEWVSVTTRSPTTRTTAPTSRSTRSPRSTSASTATPTARRGSSGSSFCSSPSACITTPAAVEAGGRLSRAALAIIGARDDSTLASDT